MSRTLVGYVDALTRPVVPLVIRGPFGSETVDAIIDTGFSFSLLLPDSLVMRLGLTPYGSALFQLGDKRLQPMPTYVGEIDWVNGRGRYEIVGSPLDVALIGRALLDGRVLRVDFGPEKRVEVR